MSSSPEDKGDIAQWIRAAKDGSNEAMGQMFQKYRHYLLLIAQGQIANGLRDKIAPSSVVQATYLAAYRHFGAQFRGETEEELLAWLRRILLNNLANEVRKFSTEQRDINREVPLVGLGDGLAAPEVSPSAQAAAREETEALDRAIALLPEDYQQVILLRNREQLTWSEVGLLLGCTPEAARKLWARALVKLHELLESPDGTP